MNKVQAAKTIIKLAKALATDSSSSRTAGANFTLTDETRKFMGDTIYRVKYSDGTLGGFVESENNLQGNAKVLDNSIIYGSAVVKDNAIIKDNSCITTGAIIKDHAVVECSNIGEYTVIEKASVIKDANIAGNAKVSNSKIAYTRISNSAKVNNSTVEDAEITGPVHIDNSIIDGSFRGCGTAKFSGRAKISNSRIECNCTISGTVQSSCILGSNSTIKGSVINSVLYTYIDVPKNKTINNLQDR